MTAPHSHLPCALGVSADTHDTVRQAISTAIVLRRIDTPEMPCREVTRRAWCAKTCLTAEGVNGSQGIDSAKLPCVGFRTLSVIPLLSGVVERRWLSLRMGRVRRMGSIEQVLVSFARRGILRSILQSVEEFAQQDWLRTSEAPRSIKPAARRQVRTDVMKRADRCVDTEQ